MSSDEELLWDQLADLGESEPPGRGQSELPTLQEPLRSQPFLNFAAGLIAKVEVLNGEGKDLTQSAVRSFLDDRGFLGPHTGDRAAVEILTFIAAELQAARIVASKNAKHMDVSGDGGSTTGKPSPAQGAHALLIKIARHLQIDHLAGQDMTGLLRRVEEALVKRMGEVPREVAQATDDLPLRGVELTQEQRAVLNEINTALREDFTLRRRMLLKRVDVTLQSFLWAEKAQGIESEIVAAVNSLREALTEAPRGCSIEDALGLSNGLMYQQACKITQEKGAGVIKARVKTMIIGEVPDRGGRADEMRPSRGDTDPYRGPGGGGRGGGGGGGWRAGGGGGGKHKGGGGGGGGGSWRGKEKGGR